MQSENGAWGAFDADNEFYYLNNIPFADHGALLDPPTEDVTARCLSMLAQFGDDGRRQRGGRSRAIDYLRRTQLAEGSWYGRWGMNYIYGTWSVLCALNAAGVDHGAPEMRKAVELARGDPERRRRLGRGRRELQARLSRLRAGAATASQTAWALLGLMAAGEVDHPAVARGIEYLADTQGADGFWDEPRYTATGFPRVFYLRYHGYSKFFPAVGAWRATAISRAAIRRTSRGMWDVIVVPRRPAAWTSERQSREGSRPDAPRPSSLRSVAIARADRTVRCTECRACRSTAS